MAQQTSALQPETKRTYWGSATHEQCVVATNPFDSYLKLYEKQYCKSAHIRLTDIFNDDDCKKDKDGNLIYPKHIDFRFQTMNILNPTVNDILFDDTLWAKHFRYKHKNKSYLKKSFCETFQMYYDKVSGASMHQIPQKNQRNCISLVAITDDKTYFIDSRLISQLQELIHLYFGLKIKKIDVTRDTHSSNVLLRKNNFDNFVTGDIHRKLAEYYESDRDIFAIIGVCSKIGLLNDKNKVIHGEHNDSTQSAVVSFNKLGVYKKLERNIPEWLKIRRCGKILLHEIAHLFGLSNCEYFRCLMNKDVVLDCVPMHLCPVCLSKLYYASVRDNKHRNTFEYDTVSLDTVNEYVMIRGGTAEEKEKRKYLSKLKKKIDLSTFNLYKRYEALAEWFEKHKCFREATWYRQRLKGLMVSVSIQCNE